jgi:NAD-dependent dihydropyrimidine dehydrogenase PreA subunit
LRALGRAGLVPEAEVRSLDLAAFQRAADHHIHGYAHAFTRDEASYAASARVLEERWRQIAAHGQARGAALVALREATALTAGARWTIAAARARCESRGLHLRADFTAPDAAFAARLLVGGLEGCACAPRNRRTGTRMIALILADRCTNCAQCVAACPTFVLEEGPATPSIARLEACQTCYMCELYCEHDAIYVAPDQFAPEAGPFPIWNAIWAASATITAGMRQTRAMCSTNIASLARCWAKGGDRHRAL